MQYSPIRCHRCHRVRPYANSHPLCPSCRSGVSATLRPRIRKPRPVYRYRNTRP